MDTREKKLVRQRKYNHSEKGRLNGIAYRKKNAEKMRAYRKTDEYKKKKAIYQKAYIEKNKDKIYAKHREYYYSHREDIKNSSKKYYEANKEKIRKYAMDYRETIKNDPTYQLKRKKQFFKRYLRHRNIMFEALGGAICKKCGFTDRRALCIDHINDDGHIERKIIKSHAKLRLQVLKEPHRYQVLCFNCNMIKKYEHDPHILELNYKD